MSSPLSIVHAAASAISGIDSLDARAKLTELLDDYERVVEQRDKLKKKNKRLKKLLARREKLVMEGAAFHLPTADGSKIGPICPVCYERDGIPSILRSTDGGAECASCGREYPDVRASVKSRGCEIY